VKYGFQLCQEYEAKRHPKNAIAEPKYDGMMVLVENGRFYNRRQRDVTHQFPEVQVDPALVLVGEIVIMQDGLSQFHMLQRRNVDNPKEIRLRSMTLPATLVAFDLLELNGQDISGEPLTVRRQALANLQGSPAFNGHIHVSGYWGCPQDKVDQYLDFMRQQLAEGIVVKDLDMPYKPNRNCAWLKLKAWIEEEFDIARHEITDKGGFVVHINHKGYDQEVVVNNRSMMDGIAKGSIQRLIIAYLPVEGKAAEASGALRQPHVRGVPWRK
jgi:ATP-dependent DNA ligase